MRLPARQASTMIRNIASRSLSSLSFSFFPFFFSFLRAHITSSWYISSFVDASSVNRSPFYGFPFTIRFWGSDVLPTPAVCFYRFERVRRLSKRSCPSFLFLAPSVRFFHPASCFCPSPSCEEKVKGRRREEKRAEAVRVILQSSILQ